jgi:hypothetical protein
MCLEVQQLAYSDGSSAAEASLFDCIQKDSNWPIHMDPLQQQLAYSVYPVEQLLTFSDESSVASAGLFRWIQWSSSCPFWMDPVQQQLTYLDVSR